MVKRYVCENCGWEQGPDRPGKEQPNYDIRNGTQKCLCPDCGSLFNTRKNTVSGL